MDVKDLTGLGAAGEKAVEAIRAAIGVWYEPTRIRRKARAESDALAIYTDAEIRRNKTLGRAAKRLAFQEYSRQQNIEAIADEALRRLPPKPPEVSPATDWMAQFFDHCKDVSDEDMRDLWSRLLAGELGSPGTFSLRTIDSVRLMSPDDARLFRAFCRGLLRFGDRLYQYVHDPRIDQLMLKIGVHTSSRRHLETIGLAHSSWLLKVETGSKTRFRYGGKEFSIENNNPPTPLDTSWWLATTLTTTGLELLSLIEVEPIEGIIDCLREVAAEKQMIVRDSCDA